MPTESQILKLDAISESLNSGAMLKAKLILNGLHPAEIARLLESSPPRQRRLQTFKISLTNSILISVTSFIKNSILFFFLRMIRNSMQSGILILSFWQY